MPLDSDDIDALIDTVAAAPKSESSNGRTITEHELQSLIALAKHRKQETAEDSAATRPGFGLRFQQITPVYR